MNLSIDIVKSASLINTERVRMQELWDWIDERRKNTFVEIEEIPITELRKWGYNKNKELIHDSGKFFSIKGLRATIEIEGIYHKEWLQPIINQPEIGFLGILAKKIDGILYFLMQAKIEPGNLNCVQISPTLQATRSNFSKVHQGKTPKYLEYFTNPDKNIIVDQLQSEQGSRFINKRNRNIIILEEEEVEIHPDFSWMTLGQLKEFLKFDNIVNMDTRSVISLLPIVSTVGTISTNEFMNNLRIYYSTELEYEKNKIASIHSWFSEKKMFIDKKLEFVALNDVENYRLDERAIYDKDKCFFSVIGCRIKVGNREVAGWDQPVIKSVNTGLFCFFLKIINGIAHFLIQAVIEPGLIDLMEMGPTIQISSDQNCNNAYTEYLEKGKYRIIYDTMQSEEGGRFYHEENRNLIIEVPEEFDEKVSDDFMWITLNQLNYFSQFSNIINIQARSLISLINCNGEF